MFRAFWKRSSKVPSRKNRQDSTSRSRGQGTFKARFEILEDRLNLSNIFTVTNASDQMAPGSLRFAIAEANLPANQGSTVVISPQVTGPINLTHGELVVQNSMTIENESGAPLTIHQSTPGARVFHVTGSRAVNVTIEGTTGDNLTITGGTVANGSGGGIMVDNASNQLTLTDVNVVGNSALGASYGDGGGVYAAGSVTLNNSNIGTIIDPNVATQMGGGLWVGKNATLNGSTVAGNSANAGGGGIFADYGTVTVTAGSTVRGNSSTPGVGGGISVATGEVVVSGASHVDDNTAWDCGGIMVGNVPTDATPVTDVAVSVTGDSTVNGNSSTAGSRQNATFLGGGGISVVSFGNIDIDDSQVDNNSTVGMYSGGVLVGIGDVTVSGGSQVDGNSNNGPGGGIAANFGGVVTVTGNSQVNNNTGGALGGGIVNFSGPADGINVTGGSQVSNNTLTNGETYARVIATFIETATGNSDLASFAANAGGKGGSAMLAGLKQIAVLGPALAQKLQQTSAVISHPFGELVAGGGIYSIDTPITISGGSSVDNNLVGDNVLGSGHTVIGTGGGIFTPLGNVTVSQSHVDNNQAPTADGDGGGIWIGTGSLDVSALSTVSGNTSTGQGGGLFVTSAGLATIENSTLQNNNGLSGGAISNAGTLTVTDSSLLDNTATDEGGAVYNDGTYTPVAVVYAGNSPDNVTNY
jgi:fibronectin-binding autotransporter adhesin